MYKLKIIKEAFRYSFFFKEKMVYTREIIKKRQTATSHSPQFPNTASQKRFN